MQQVLWRCRPCLKPSLVDEERSLCAGLCGCTATDTRSCVCLSDGGTIAVVFVFYLLGSMGILAGAGWAALALNAAASARSAVGSSAAADNVLAGAAGLVVAAPGVGLILSGLLLLAIGGGLARLDGIVRQVRRTNRILESIAERTEVR